MQAAILCGGPGTRLRGLFPDLPKAMVPVDGQPFLAHQLAWLRGHQITEIILCAGYRWELIADYFGDGSCAGVQLRYSVEPFPLGTAGALSQPASLMTGPVLVLNGDTFLHFDPHALFSAHREQQAVATVAVTPTADTRDYGTVAVDAAGRICAFREKQPGAGLVSVGAYVFDPDVLRALPNDRPTSLEHELLPGLVRAGKSVFAWTMAGAFLDIGTPERYRQAQGRGGCQP